MNSWQIQHAKAQLSTVLRHAEIEGPQEITNHGPSVAILLSRADYDRLTRTNKTLVEFMQNLPLFNNEDISIERNISLTREIPL
jgi:prevent-host-death family protein